MNERGARLLSLSDQVLFNHGGCHVFALALHNRFDYPLLCVTGTSPSYYHLHIACAPTGGGLLDFFGWFSFEDYIKQERLIPGSIKFLPTSSDRVRKRFTTDETGVGLFAEPTFFLTVTTRADEWIDGNIQYFDGSIRTPIGSLKRIQTAPERDLW